MNSAEIEHNDNTDKDGNNLQKLCEKYEKNESENKIEPKKLPDSEVKTENEHNEKESKENNENSYIYSLDEENKYHGEFELGLVMECEVIDVRAETVKELAKIELWCQEWLEETDDRLRECTIHLMTTRGPLGCPLAFHWALKFVWEDGYTATYEAGIKDKSGKLIPRWRIGGPERGQSWQDRGVWDEWSAPGYKASPCSPLQVNQVARNLHLNSTQYHAINNNGQKWARAVAFPFGVELPLGAASTAGQLKLTNTYVQQDSPEE
ncbi:unnamed protein product [Meganyctiphanes norvegica]|uniref:Uncharacterized protein n=1 Tax=Meganyctiphanes norvegica TaxID=48144 RepID=A0AAV2Q328_MEGNR